MQTPIPPLHALWADHQDKENVQKVFATSAILSTAFRDARTAATTGSVSNPCDPVPYAVSASSPTQTHAMSGNIRAAGHNSNSQLFDGVQMSKQQQPSGMLTLTTSAATTEPTSSSSSVLIESTLVSSFGPTVTGVDQTNSTTFGGPLSSTSGTDLTALTAHTTPMKSQPASHA